MFFVKKVYEINIKNEYLGVSIKVNLEEERNNYTKKLEKQLKGIDTILSLNNDLINYTELTKIKKEGEVLQKKFLNNEFEIAVVGLEKAGKSSFSNAFIENDILPTDDGRCTYTSTCIKYSKSDKANITFYSKEEFNRDFVDKLSKVGISGEYSFDELSLEEYERLVGEVSYHNRDDKIHEDIIDVLKNKNDIRSKLDNMPITYQDDSFKDFIREPKKALAVKKVEILSSKLGGMKNSIIYDVPGFNSPTTIHKQQTLLRMKEADAIIIIAKGDEPSITAEILSIFKEYDDDGIQLSEKLFVFANKSDRATDIEKNKRLTYEEWIERRKIIDSRHKDRIFFGSANAHLEKIGKISGTKSLDTLNAFGMSDGIDDVKKALEEYNKIERLQILKKRFNKLQNTILKFFDTIHEKYSNTGNSKTDIEKYSIVLAVYDSFTKEAVTSLEKYKNQIINDMPQNKLLSQQIQNFIKENIITEKYGISDEEINNQHIKDIDISATSQPKAVEVNIRKDKFKEMYDDFSSEIKNMAVEEHKKCFENIVEILMKCFNMESNKYEKEVIAALKKDINEICGYSDEENTNIGYYQSLTERFSRDIYEVLINSPYTEERYNKFYKEMDNFFSLSIFYSKSNSNLNNDYSISPIEQPLCRLLLFHDEFQNNDITKANEIYNRIKELTGIVSDYSEILSIVEKLLFHMSHKEVIELVEKMFHYFNKEDTEENRYYEIKTMLNQKCKNFSQSNNDIIKNVTDKNIFEKEYKKYHTERDIPLDDYEHIKLDFDIDIKILNDILTNAVVKAINIEKTFVARQAKIIEDMINYVKSEDLRSFISENIKYIKHKEYAEIKEKESKHQKNKDILHIIERIYSDIKKGR